MIYLRVFNEHSAYTEYCASSEHVIPNVCACLDEGKAHFEAVRTSVTSITLDKYATYAYLGKTEKITATVLPNDAPNKNVVWSSSDDSIATVDSNGLITPKTEGRINITAITLDGGLTASCQVQVAQNGYLEFVALESGTFRFTPTLSSDTINYSIDGGNTWAELASGVSTPTIASGQSILWKGNFQEYNVKGIGRFYTNGQKFNVKGNAMSLFYGDNYENQEVMASRFFQLFSSTNVVSASKLILPTKDLLSEVYGQMFNACKSLTEIPILIATGCTMDYDHIYKNMFLNCTSLVDASIVLPRETLYGYAYESMFQGCTSLKYPPKIMCKMAGGRAFQKMFYDCTSMEEPPQMCVTKVSFQAFINMFLNCTSLKYGPELVDDNFKEGAVYTHMFENCYSLEVAPMLPSKNLTSGCYSYMFKNCISLRRAPELPATTLANDCYKEMFNGCINLNYIKADFTTAPDSAYTMNWVSDVAENGTFIKSDDAEWNPEEYRGVDGVPETWMVNNDNGLFGIVPSSNAMIVMPFDCQYSVDYGKTWTSLAANTSLSVSSNTKAFFKASATVTSNGIGTIQVNNSQYIVNGNIMSLIDGGEPSDTLYGKDHAFKGLFSGSTNLTSAKNLRLPSTISVGCYESMFEGCTSLTAIPKLNATALTANCYEKMFKGCTSLTVAPSLPLTTLANACYKEMFSGCIGITAMPTLPSQTLTESCYEGMFKGCSGITKSTVLNAQTLVTNCYKEMFYECSSLSSITAYFMTEPGTAYTLNWVYGVASEGTFVKNKNAEWDVSGVNGIPDGWSGGIDYSTNYFTIRSLEDSNTISLYKHSTATGNTEYYSTDNGVTWTQIASGSGSKTITTINSGQTILIKAIGSNGTSQAQWATDYNKNSYFNATKTYEVYGNAMSLLVGDNFLSATTIEKTFALCGIFYGGNNSSKLINAKNLILPATTLTESAYNGMFRGCKALQHGPKLLPALVVPKDGYSSFFEECISLVEAPKIMATTVSGDTALNRMFCMNREDKVTAAMTKGPVLRVTNPSAYSNTYQQLFAGNGNITEVTMLAEGTNLSFANWLANVSSSGVIKKLSTTTFTSGVSGLPSGWTTENVVE